MQPKQRTQPTGHTLTGKTPIAPVSTPPTHGKGLALPHEKDESTSNVAEAPDPKIVQAKRDIDAGLVDTDMRATPGLDADLRRKMVPGPGGKPPPSGR
jgi:hypothetical protein